jgi:hypothetical protein
VGILVGIFPVDPLIGIVGVGIIVTESVAGVDPLHRCDESRVEGHGKPA